MARSFGYQRVLCTTTGNHGVSLAAYAAAGRLECLVACQPDVETVAVQQMRLYGVRVVVLDGSPSEGRALLGRMFRDEACSRPCGTTPARTPTPLGSRATRRSLLKSGSSWAGCLTGYWYLPVAVTPWLESPGGFESSASWV